jgi:dipeptidyl aminopeptidase/acylaminoacyl peptidase
VTDSSNPGEAALRARVARWLRVPASTAPSVTHDGETVLFVSDREGVPQAWRMPARGGDPRRLFAEPERVGAISASPVGPRAVVALDAGGNEHWELKLLELGEGASGRPPAPRPLTDDPAKIHFPGRWHEDGRRYIFAANLRDERFFDVFEMDVEAGVRTARPLFEKDGWNELAAVGFGHVVAQHFRTFLDVELWLCDGGGNRLLNPHDEEVTVFSADVTPDGVYAGANPGRELAALVRYRFNGQLEFVREFPGDVELVRAAPDGRRLAVVVNRDGWSEAHLLDLETGEDRPLVSGPRGVIESVRWFPDGSAFVYALSSIDGADLYLRTIATGKEKRLTHPPEPPSMHLPAPKLGQLRTSDRFVVPFWEYARRDRTSRGTIVSVHGGPEGQARPDFDPVRSFLVEDGWRVVEPNVRGSLGYGRTFVHSDDRRRRMDSVRDLKEVADHLRGTYPDARGGLGVMGGSYGGFMVLAAITTAPELWLAAVDIVGIANFVTFLERTSIWRRALREVEYGSLEADREFLESISPIRRVDAIRTPLLVVHGRNDPRVPFHEAEQIVGTLRSKGRPVEFLAFDNEGHGVVRRENREVVALRVAQFFAAHLGPKAETPPPTGRDSGT